jgi:hypothetical protein
MMTLNASRQPSSVTDGFTLGLVLGLAFGVVDLVGTWLAPLADDTPIALLIFYGPMFVAWGIVAFRAARRSGRVTDAIKVGTTIAFATFLVYIAANFVRVNLFLDTIRFRVDWQDLVRRFHASGSGSLRAFVNYDYLKGTPLKIGVASAIGAGTGLVGGLAALLSFRITRVWHKMRGIRAHADS